MKKLLLILGVAAIVACAAFFFLGVIRFSAYRTLVDGAAETYRRLHRQTVRDFILSGASAAVAAVSFILRVRM